MFDWQQTSWEEIDKRIAAGTTSAMLPVGATEQHGPQLGCGVDTSIAHNLCGEVAKRTPVALLPTLPYGCSIGHSHKWPGTIALQPKTLIDVVFDIGSWAYESGIKRLFIINAHVTNFAPLRCALEMLRAKYDDLMIALINTPEISTRVKEKHFSDAEDWHANDAETSLMMAIDPSLVKPEKIASSDDEDRTEDKVFAHPVNRTSTNGVTGTPSLASIEKGKELFSWMLDDLLAVLEAGAKEQAPINHSYFEKVSS